MTGQAKAARRPARHQSLGARLVLGMFGLYRRFISPMSAPSCRYYPSCSTYAVRAVREHGAAQGLILATWRLLRCNPWTSGGVDDVPERFEFHVHGHVRWPIEGLTDDVSPAEHSSDRAGEPAPNLLTSSVARQTASKES